MMKNTNSKLVCGSTKTILWLLLLLMAPKLCYGWVPYGTPAVDTSVKTHKRQISEIQHELQELGQEIKPQTFKSESEGFEYHESLVHKLRREIHQKDEHYRHAMKDMQTSLDRIEEQLKAYAIVAETAEVELQYEMKDREQEHESMRRLMGDMRKLMGRRIRSIPRRIGNFFLSMFGGGRKTKKN